jgi:DNA-binding PadR family transcriptional regulator
MAKGESLGEFEHLVLLALLRLGDEAYGLAVRREIAQRAERDVTIGAVYATLERLKDKGLVRSRQTEASEERGGRGRRYFKLTAEGDAALQATHRALQRMAQDLGLGFSR